QRVTTRRPERSGAETGDDARVDPPGERDHRAPTLEDLTDLLAKHGNDALDFLLGVELEHVGRDGHARVSCSLRRRMPSVASTRGACRCGAARPVSVARPLPYQSGEPC